MMDVNKNLSFCENSPPPPIFFFWGGGIGGRVWGRGVRVDVSEELKFL